MNIRYRLLRYGFSLVFILSLLAMNSGSAASRSTGQTPGGDPTIYLPLINNYFPIPPTVGWSTVAGDAQRTSWTQDAVTGSVHLEWALPVEAYIPQNAQLIAANGMIYVATARGLLALNADNGSVIWRFNTEMPIGNSPTVVGGVVYVAGYDRKVHALNAFNGAQFWENSDAKAGYDTNPLVVENLVILGNRDGSLYAIHAQSGQLAWKFTTDAPISLTAAYKDGVVFFASNDQYAYAVTTSGALKWKSQKMPGDGIQSYWPVIYHDPITQKDLVVFSESTMYRFFAAPGTESVSCPDYSNPSSIVPCDNSRFYNEDLFYDKSTDPNTPLSGYVSVGQTWAAGRNVVNFSRMSEFYENNPQADPHLHKPWRRFYVLLDAADGSEFTYDSDHDGYGEYAPIVPFLANAGNAYPPIVGPDGLLYFNNMLYRNGQGKVMGWRVGTPYLAVVGLQGDSAEPQALSGAGTDIYRSICCDRVGDWVDINTQAAGYAWTYGNALSDQAPGYDQMWYFLDTGLDRLYGNYGGVNGIYHNHGDQNPIIPYNGRLYVHRSNAVIAFGTHPKIGTLPLLRSVATSQPEVTPSSADLSARLTNEVSKMIAAGHLRPGLYNAGQFNIYQDLNDYFQNPGDTLYALANAYPYVSAAVQPQLKTYLASEFSSYFDPTMYSLIGWKDGAAREASLMPKEMAADLVNYPKSTNPGPAWSWSYPQYNFYGMWKYALVVPASAGHIYDLAKSKLQVPVPAANSYFTARPFELNGYIAGYIGFLNLQQVAGRSATDASLRTQVTNELNRIEQLRASTFTKDTYYTAFDQGYTHRTLNVARNFIMMVPELGAYLHANALSKVQAAVTEYNNIGPYWFVSRYNASIGESAMQNLYDYHGMFLAKAYILQESPDQLTKYLDAPAFYRGDLFYIQNLTAALQAISPMALVPVTSLQVVYKTPMPSRNLIGQLKR